MEHGIPGIFWIIVIISAVLHICMIVWFYELRENSKTQSKLLNEQNALSEQQNKIDTAQLNLLAGLADKTGVPVNDINEVVNTGNELIAELEKLPSLNVLQPKECVYNAARSHGLYQKRVKKFGHAVQNNLYANLRLKSSCSQSNYCGENLVGGGETVRSSLITLLINDGISDRGHRRNILNSDWKYVGCHYADEVNGVINSWVQVFTNK